MLEQAEVDELWAEDHVGPPTSHVCAASIALLFLISLVVCWARWARARAEARRLDGLTAQRLGVGRATVRGTVERCEGTAAVRTVIRQDGREWKTPKGWRHEWKEVGRETTAWPFELRTPTGQAVRVEPGRRVVLVDRLDGTEWTDRERRARVSELVVGEEAFVSGELAHGEGDAAWVLRPAPNEALGVSTEPPGAAPRVRARSCARAGVATVALASVVALLFSTYLARLVLGEPSEAVVVARREQDGRDRFGDPYRLYHVRLQVDGANAESAVELEVSPEQWARLEEGARVPVRDVRSWRYASSLGAGTSMYLPPLMGALLVSLFALLILLSTSVPPRWHEAELTEEASGRLPEPP